MFTNWGYSVNLSEGAQKMPPLMTVAEFRAATGGVMSSTDLQIGWALDAVSQVVRDYCGWHVAPVLSCSFTGDGEGRFLKLPAMNLQKVDCLKINGRPVDAAAYQWTVEGLVRLSCGVFPHSWRSAYVEFTAGCPCAGALAAAVCQMASNALAAAPGVQSEQAGQVRIEYNRTGNGVAGGVALLDRERQMLAPYRISGV